MPDYKLNYRAASQTGLTLIELLVAVIVGAVVSLAVFGVLFAAEGRKRSSVSVDDINQSGNYSVYSAEQWIRSAGSVFAQGAVLSTGRVFYPLGCVIHAAKSGAQLLPSTGALPSPLSEITLTTYRLAPVLIYPEATTPGVSGAKSDALIIMSSNNGGMQTGNLVAGDILSNSLGVANALDYASGDVVLVASQNNLNSCFVEQVGSSVTSSSTSLPLDGVYAAASVNSNSLTSLDKDQSAIFNMGNVDTGMMPKFQVVAVGGNNTLYSYDLLKSTSNPMEALADGVFEMHALYGVDSDADGVIDSWVKPSVLASSGTYAWANLTAGTLDAGRLIFQIKAVRVGLIMRTSLKEKNQVSPASLSLFSDLGSSIQYSRSLSDDERYYRYRTVEGTIAIRNALGAMN